MVLKLCLGEVLFPDPEYPLLFPTFNLDINLSPQKWIPGNPLLNNWFSRKGVLNNIYEIHLRLLRTPYSLVKSVI